MRTSASHASDCRKLLPQFALIAASPLFFGLLAVPSIGWLPPAEDAWMLLGVLLGVQGTIAALTLAVTSFVVRGVSDRQASDDRIYTEYFERSSVRPIFRASVAAVGVTALVLLGEEFIAASPAAAAARGLDNLALVAVVALAVNAALPLVLFERAVQLTRPDKLRTLQRELYERDVTNAVDVFLARYGRAIEGLDQGDPDFADTFPDPGEELADEAVRALLGGALRAMSEWRQGDFEWSLDTTRRLIAHAMDEIQRDHPGWSPPGLRAERPPLAEWDRSLYPFREEVIIRGGSWYANQLATLDLRLAGLGVDRRCGELFTAALRGYASSYSLAIQAGNDDFRDLFRRRAWLYLRDIFAGDTDEELPYLRELAWHHGRLLFRAMDAGHIQDFRSLRDDFAAVLRNVRQRAERAPSSDEDPPAWVERAEQDGRVVFMQLGGVALTRGESDAVADAQPYLDVIRSEYQTVEQLALDIPRAMEIYDEAPLFWEELLGSATVSIEWRAGRPSNYALQFISLRLVELAADPMPRMNLDGRARATLNWFEANVGRLEGHAQLGDEETWSRQRELVATSLRDAVRADEVSADEEIIERELSADRITRFRESVAKSIRRFNVIERVFDREGAKETLPWDADDAPGMLGSLRLLEKGSLTEKPDGTATTYAEPDGEEWGRAEAKAVTQRLIEALEQAPEREAIIDSPEEMLSAIDGALEDLRPNAGVLVVLVGDWGDLFVRLQTQPPDSYEPRHAIPEADRVGEHARYKGYPIIRVPEESVRVLYLVEPRAWGVFVRAQVDGEADVLVEVDPISAEQASELLIENPDHIPDDPEESTKIRKLQTYVRLGVWFRTDVRVTDPSRARRIVPPESAD